MKVNDEVFLEVYTTSENTQEVVDRLRNEYDVELSKAAVSARASLLRKRFIEAGSNLRKLRKTGRPRKNVQDLVNQFGKC